MGSEERWFVCVCLLFIYGCAESSLLRTSFLQLWRAGATLQFRGSGFSQWGLLLLKSLGSRLCWLQQLWHPSLVSPQQVESSQTRDPACVPCTGSGFLTIGPPGKFKRWFFGNLLSSWSASFPIKTFIPVPTTCLPTDWSVYCVRGRESLGSVIELG